MKRNHLRKKYRTILCITFLILTIVMGLTGCKKDEKADSKVSDEEQEKYDKLISKGRNYAKEGDYESAISSFEKAIKLIPEDVIAYKKLYNAYVELENYDEAEAILKNGKSSVTDEFDERSLNRLENELEEIKNRPINLTLWCIAVEGNSIRPAYEKAIQELQTKFPKINIYMEAIENEAYKEKIKNAMAYDMVNADIFFSWSGSFLSEFVKNDRVYCLDDVFKDYIGKDIESKMFDNVTFDGHIYGVPTTMNVVTMFANMDILAKVGYYDVPKTYNELIDCCDKLISIGVIPFGCAGWETWCVTEYLEPLAEKIIGSDALSSIFKGEATYNNPGLETAVNILQEWIAKGYFDPAGATSAYEQIKSNFIEGKYAFFQNGNWNCSEISEKARFSVKAAEFPVIDSTRSSLGQLIGGPSDVLAVNKGSKNAAKAAEYVVELGKAICHYAYLDECGLPAWNVDYDDSSLNYLTRQVAELCRNASKLTLFGDTKMSDNDKAYYLSYVDGVYSFRYNGNDFISGLSNYLR